MQAIFETLFDIVYLVTVVILGICSLRPLAVVNAFFNGRYAEQNGRSYLVDC